MKKPLVPGKAVDQKLTARQPAGWSVVRHIANALPAAVSSVSAVVTTAQEPVASPFAASSYSSPMVTMMPPRSPPCS